MEVKTIAVIGAGAIGRSMVLAAASAGYKTVLEDMSSRVLEEAMFWIQQRFDESVALGTVDASARAKALALLAAATDVKGAICDAELIIETVPDELEMKLELFTIFDKFAKAGAIFASTASSLSITDFTDIAIARDQCIGLHFLDASPGNLIELVRTPYTSEETVAACCEVARRMGKQVVVVEEAERTVYHSMHRPGKKTVAKKA